MKYSLIAAVMLLLPGIGAFAQSHYLHVATETGWEVIDLDKADRLTFSNGVMTVSDVQKNVIASFSQDKLDKMYVNDQSGVETVLDSQANTSFRVEESGRIVKVLVSGKFEVFDLTGARLVEISSVEPDMTVSLSGLDSGVYVLRLGEYSLKCSIR